MIYFLIISVAAVVYFAQRSLPPTAQNAELQEVDNIPSVEIGTPIPVIFGAVSIQSANVVWYGDLGYNPIKTSSGK